MRIYLATWLEGDQGVTLTKMNVKDRLLSYYFVISQTRIKFSLSEYVKTGLIDDKKDNGDDK